MSQTNRLFSRSFVALSAIQFLAFCNVAVFFPFYSYLRTLPIDPHWLGFLIGAYALSAVVVRPVISPLLHLGNARRWMFFSSIGFIGALPLYSLADGFWTMLAVRTLHGAFHAGLVSAMLAMVVAFIPKEKSGQAFALLSVNTLLPYAIIPPMLGPLQHMLGGYEHVLTAGAVVMLLCFPLLLLVQIPVQDAGAAGDCHQRMTMADISENLKNSKLVILLIITLLLYSSFTPVFFFIKGYGDSIGIRTPGLFFYSGHAYHDRPSRGCWGSLRPVQQGFVDGFVAGMAYRGIHCLGLCVRTCVVLHIGRRSRTRLGGGYAGPQRHDI